MVLLHGRSAGARDILTLADEVAHPEIAYLAPQAAGNSWYPFSFLALIEQNEPYLSSALDAVASVGQAVAAAGIPPERKILLGFRSPVTIPL